MFRCLDGHVDDNNSEKIARRTRREATKAYTSLSLTRNTVISNLGVVSTQKIKRCVHKWKTKWIGPFKVLYNIGPITHVRLLHERQVGERSKVLIINRHTYHT